MLKNGMQQQFQAADQYWQPWKEIVISKIFITVII